MIGLTEILHIDQKAMDKLIQPDFASAGRVHDWRNHVPGTLQAIWGQLSYESRLIIYYMAEDAAMREEWE